MRTLQINQTRRPRREVQRQQQEEEDCFQEKEAAAKVVEVGETEPFPLVRNHKKGKKPNDIALRQWVKAYVVCFDMDSATTKHAIKTASDRFGFDLAKRKNKRK
jgi:hypothetical protein